MSNPARTTTRETETLARGTHDFEDVLSSAKRVLLFQVGRQQGGDEVPVGMLRDELETCRYAMLRKTKVPGLYRATFRHVVYEVWTVCSTCETYRRKESHARVDISALQRAMMYGCTCEPGAAEEAQAYLDLVSQ